ncbi:MAG: DUF5916 domain-containing protein [Gammaproteobacteria bacterium]
MKSAPWSIGLVLLLTPNLALGAITVDGELTEPEWSQAQLFTDFRVTQPYTLGKPRHPTEVRMLGTPEGIIVGFRCTHPRSTPRQTEQTPRDTDNNGDRVNIFIDLDADAKVAYNVTVALAGSLQDATITNENQYSTDWDGDVSYAVRQTEDEWFVEVLLPWTMASMKNPGADKRTVGIVFDRVIGETQERSALQGLSFNLPRYLSDFPKVEIDQFARSLFHVFPYASAASDWVHSETDLKFGADVLWKPSGKFQLTAALNPDFGQVEADELVVNFDAIEVLFSDKRPFFAENQALFDVRVGGNTDRLLYTRRIGGGRDDDPQRAAEIDGAVKLNGSFAHLDYGFLSAAERDFGDDIGRAFAAQRLRYSAGPWTLGYLGTWADRPFLDRTAQVHSSDFIWRPDSRFILQGQVIASIVDEAAQEASGDGEVLQAFYTPSAAWQHEARLTHFSRGLDFNDLGFQQRSGVKRAGYSIARRLRDFGARDPRAAVMWRMNPELRWNDAGDRLGHYLGVFREARQRSGALLNTSLEVAGDGVDDLISRGNGNAKTEPRLLGLTQSYQSARIGKWRNYAAATLLQEGNEDFALEAEGKAEYFARDDFSVSVRGVMLWSRDWLIWQSDNLLASYRRKQALVASDLNWFPAPNQELRVKVQWLAIDARDPTPFRIAASGDLIESADVLEDFQVNNFGLQIRYRWTFATQSDLYVVYGRGGIVFEQGSQDRGLGDLFTSAVELRDSDQLIVKARYRF